MKSIMTMIDNLMRKEHLGYTLNIKSNELHLHSAAIVVKTKMLGVAKVNYDFFKEIVNMLDEFSVLPMADGERVTLYFGLHHVVSIAKE